jgi:MscS family membrane protein
VTELLSWVLNPLLNAIPALTQYQWLLQGAVILLMTVIVSLVSNTLLNRLVPFVNNLSSVWNQVFIDTVRAPLSLLVWVVGITLSLDIAARALDEIDLVLTQSLRSLAYILLAAWTLIRLIKRVEQQLVEGVSGRPGVDRTTADAVAKLLRLTVLLFAGLVLLQHLGVSVSGILAFGGVGGLAVGFAAKDLLANFFGGLMIYMDRPFKVGDWIRSPDKEIEGTVEEIGWRLTRIRTFDKRPLYVPNSTFASIAVENPSRMTNRRIYETIGVRYDDAAVDEIDQTQTLIVNLNHFGASSIDIMVYTFTKTVNWVEFHSVKQDVLVKIINLVEARGAEIAFPTSTIHIAPNEAPSN